jgi:hypothetical protein
LVAVTITRATDEAVDALVGSGVLIAGGCVAVVEKAVGKSVGAEDGSVLGVALSILAVLQAWAETANRIAMHTTPSRWHRSLIP